MASSRLGREGSGWDMNGLVMTCVDQTTKS